MPEPDRTTAPDSALRLVSKTGDAPLVRVLVQTLILCGLAFAGLVLKIAVAATDPLLFGENARAVADVANVAPIGFMLLYATAGTVMAARRRARTVSRARIHANTTTTEAQAEARERRTVARARRRAAGMPKTVRGRADFLVALSGACKVKGEKNRRASIILVNAAVEGLDVDEQDFLHAEMGGAIAEQLADTCTAGYLGAGLFGICVSDASEAEAHATYESIRQVLLEVTVDYDGGISDTLVTATGDESAVGLYQRAMGNVREASVARLSDALAA